MRTEKMFWRDPGAKIIENLHALHQAQDRTGAINTLRGNFFKMRHVAYGIVTASSINRNAKIPLSTKLPHPNGIFIHRNAMIGEDCMIMHQVTIGQIGPNTAPTIGRGVYIGAGAKILGAVTVGDYARIGANAVVVKDVPAHCAAVGVPAKILPPKD